jgi:hypothetical protein
LLWNSDLLPWTRLIGVNPGGKTKRGRTIFVRPRRVLIILISHQPICYELMWEKPDASRCAQQ